MGNSQNSTLLISMPFAGIDIPSIQLSILESYLKKHNQNICSLDLYLKAAEIYGLKNYNSIINPPNDSYSAQMIFSKYVFPDHWKKNKTKFEKYFNENISKNNVFGSGFNFEQFENKTDKFYNWIIKNVNWESFEIIGFTLNYGQFLPSLAIAKKIKELYPNKKIVLGGSRTVGELGINTLECFNYVDYIVSGDGENPLLKLAIGNTPNKIPNLIYRDEKRIVSESEIDVININSLPIPDYDSFLNNLNITCEEIKQYFFLYGRLPIEISRGCWWNKCTFCNLNIQHKEYREKNVDKIVKEIEYLSEKYKILNFQLIGNTLPKSTYKNLLEKIISLDKDFSFFVEARAGQLKSSDYKLLKEAGFTSIQTGVETFSQNYIKKMNKGVRVIDNVASLKFCRENDIKNMYNVIINYPNEEKIDFEETKENIQNLKQFIEPPQISNLVVEYGSNIQQNPSNFNIKKLENTRIDKIMFPERVLEKNVSFYFDYSTYKKLSNNGWKKIIKNWQDKYTQIPIEESNFYYVDGKDFLKIYDKREKNQEKIIILDEIEREIFLTCTDVVSYNKLSTRFSNIPDYQLAAILHSFEKSNIVYKEDNFYLSLPLHYTTKTIKNYKSEKNVLVYNSGKNLTL